MITRTFVRTYVRILKGFRKMKELLSILGDLGLEGTEITTLHHQTVHAAAAYRSAPWPYNEKVLVFTCDGSGDGLSATVSIGEKARLTRVAETSYYDSVGTAFYSEITAYLGLKRWDNEYKTMGLAPYGRPEQCLAEMRKIVRLNPSNPLQFENTIGAYLPGDIQKKLRRILSGKRFDDIAAASQAWLEQLLTTWVDTAAEEYSIRKIACAGGVFLNVKANQRILESCKIDDAFFCPVAGDDGQALGAALEGYYQFCEREGLDPIKQPLQDLYLGPSYDESLVEKALSSSGWLQKAEKHGNIDGVVGEHLAKGGIVARFAGRLETGPRALGNRSILADARDLKVIRRINFAIKHRDFWMPFAPTILEDRIKDYLVNPRSAPYMILSFHTTNNRDDIVAGIHPFDLTCRPQTLNPAWNEGYASVLREFEKITGAGGILNTSFNLHGYPIVGTPEHALWTLEQSDLDYLAIGDYLVKKH
jgi:carbamoyltransferase